MLGQNSSFGEVRIGIKVKIQCEDRKGKAEAGTGELKNILLSEVSNHRYDIEEMSDIV